MQLAIERSAGGLDVRDIEEMAVGAARKAGADCFPDSRTRAIAARDVACLTIALLAVRAAQPRQHAVLAIGEADQLGPPLDRDAEGLQPLDQQPLVLALGKDRQERVR